MKINKIAKYKEIFGKEENWYKGYANERRLLRRYEDNNKGELIAYREGFMGVVFLFKSAKIFVGFSIIDEPFNKWSNVNIYRLDLPRIKQVLCDKIGIEPLVIVNKELFEQFNRSLIIEALKE